MPSRDERRRGAQCKHTDPLAVLQAALAMPAAMLALASLLLWASGAAAAPNDEPPVIPVAGDAYRLWERWPYQRIGQRAHMRSTYDRAGGNDAADASHFRYQLTDDYNVKLDVAGAGILYFARTNRWHGSPWHYTASPGASAPYTLRSRYERGPDTLSGHEIYPANTDRGRTTRSGSEFNLRVDPDNRGIQLRRKLDYAFPNQRALVYVRDVVGAWQLAGSNSSVFSDEFLIPAALTRDRALLRVRIRFTPVATPLFAGHRLPRLAWSEIRYSAYSFIIPRCNP